MTVAIALGAVVLAIVLLASDRIPIEVSSLAIVVLLVLTRLVTPEEALAGFSSETAIFIFALLALTQGLEATGVMQLAGRRLLMFSRFGPTVFLVVLLTVVCAFSSVASNTAVTAAFLPVVMSPSIQAKVSPARLLMPMAFASMLGGTIFLFGTSTNLVASAAMQGLGLRPIGFAELTPAGLLLSAAGIALTLLLVRRLLPVPATAAVSGALGSRTYVTEAVLAPNSRLAGKELRLLTDTLGIPVQAVVRQDTVLPPDPALRLSTNDHLIVSGGLQDILRIKDLRSIGLRADARFPVDPREPRQLAEVSIPPTSNQVGRTLAESRFAERYGAVVLAIHRHPSLQTFQAPMKHVRLSAGDLLLISGQEGRLRALAADEDFTTLSGVEYERPRYRRALLAVVIFAATVVAAGLRLTSPAIAGLAGLLVMIATGCVNARTAFRVDWRVPILIGSLLTLGLAMEKSGAGEFLARGVIPLSEWVGPRGVLAALMLGTILLSIPMSNQAAALIMLPVGVHAAVDLGVEPRSFAIGVCLAASCSFLTPLEPSAALVYGPGRYRFSDFLRVGSPITAALLVLLTAIVPVLWPFS